MKRLFESWRKFVNERIDYAAPKEHPEFDLGDAFPKLHIDDIILHPQKDTIRKIVFLDIFNQLEAETDEANVKHILKSLQQMSGNSPDFTFDTRNDALKLYKTPYMYKARQDDPKPTKSLKDYHNLMKAIKSRLGPTRRKAIRDFYANPGGHETSNTKFVRAQKVKKVPLSNTVRAKK